MKTKLMISMLIVGTLTLSNVGCSKNPEETSPPSPSAKAEQTRQSDTPAHKPDNKPSTPDHIKAEKPSTPSDSSLCVTMPSADLTALTGLEYSTTNSTANFSTIKHCEYFSDDAKHSVSILIAFDAAAKQQMEQNRVYPGIVPVPNLGDDAIWEPAQGSLTVLDGNRCTVVRLSSSHGDDEARRSLATTIAKQVLDRY